MHLIRGNLLGRVYIVTFPRPCQGRTAVFVKLELAVVLLTVVDLSALGTTDLTLRCHDLCKAMVTPSAFLVDVQPISSRAPRPHIALHISSPGNQVHSCEF